VTWVKVYLPGHAVKLPHHQEGLEVILRRNYNGHNRRIIDPKGPEMNNPIIPTVEETMNSFPQIAKNNRSLAFAKRLTVKTVKWAGVAALAIVVYSYVTQDTKEETPS
jgi:hypothetical protein